MAVDSDGNEYNPDAGSTTPTEGRCNHTLTNWRERYGERRYCTQYPESHFVDDGAPQCRLHKGLEKGRQVRAQELFQHGLFTRSVDNLYRRLDVNQRLMAWGLFGYLLDESRYEFGPEHELKSFAIDEDAEPPHIPQTAYDDVVLEEDDDGRPSELAIEVSYPTDHGDRAMALWLAAIDRVKMHNVQAKIAADEMERTTTEHAEFAAATEGGDGESPRSWQTIEEVNEHHLNLPYSRLVRDHTELLAYGGIPIDGESETSGSIVLGEDFSFGITADPEAAESREVVSKTEDDYEELVAGDGPDPSDED